MLSRREFLRLSSLAGAGLLLPWNAGFGCGDPEPSGDTGGAMTQPTGPAPWDRFVDKLPVPEILEPDISAFDGQDFYRVSLSQFMQQVHGGLSPTTVWGYGGTYPGPTIVARRGRPVRVRWDNSQLPQVHILRGSIDPTIPHGRQLPQVRTVTHLHGAHVQPRFDGQPDSWADPGAVNRGERFSEGDFVYPNDQRACCLWYHDHALGITRLNVYAGLAGFYIIRDEEEDMLGLPSGNYEIPLLIQDRSFNPDGSLFYPVWGVTSVHPVWSPHFLGDTPVVNGKAYPVLEVEPRLYRFRLLNGSQSRFYTLRLESEAGAMAFQVIGTDGGLLPGAAGVTRLKLAPAERADLLVDFSQVADGISVMLRNEAPAPFPGGGGPIIDEIMMFTVVAAGDDSAEISPAVVDTMTAASPITLPAFERLAPDEAVQQREIVLLENVAPDLALTGNGEHTAGTDSVITELLFNGLHFTDPVEEMPVAGTTEIWQFVNMTPESHPMHIHLVQFQILGRQEVDTESYYAPWQAWRNGSGPRPDLSAYLVGEPEPPSAEEAGGKDTAWVDPNQVLRVIARFDLPEGTERPASYIFHCHILEHEDNDMMRPFEVI